MWHIWKGWLFQCLTKGCSSFLFFWLLLNMMYFTVWKFLIIKIVYFILHQTISILFSLYLYFPTVAIFLFLIFFKIMWTSPYKNINFNKTSRSNVIVWNEPFECCTIPCFEFYIFSIIFLQNIYKFWCCESIVSPIK